MSGKPPVSRQRWTPERDQELRCLIFERTPYLVIARRLNTSMQAVRNRCAVLGVCLSRSTGLRSRQVDALLGWGLDVCAGRWRRAGLPFEDAGISYARGRCRTIRRTDLEVWLSDEASWPWWEADWITEDRLRAWARELRAGRAFLTTAQVGDRLGLTHYRINQLIREGRLRGVKSRVGSNWLVREDWTTPQVPRSLAGTRKPLSLDTLQRAQVAAWWGTRTATEIAARLGVGEGSVSGAARRMGLPAVGRGMWKGGLPADVRAWPQQRCDRTTTARLLGVDAASLNPWFRYHRWPVCQGSRRQVAVTDLPALAARLLDRWPVCQGSRRRVAVIDLPALAARDGEGAAA